MLKEFKTFISRGNVVDLAVGVIIGGAFGKIVTSLVNDLIMPLVGILLGGINLSHLSFTLGESVVYYGSFLQNIVDFFIVAACVFLFVKTINKLSELNKKNEEEKKEEKPVETELTVLKELLAEIKKQNKKSSTK